MGRGRGHLTSLLERQQLVEWIGEARCNGARLVLACRVAELSVRSFERWTREGEVKADGRPTACHPEPANKLSEAERDMILDTINEPRFASLPPLQIVPQLVDEGVYLASESSFYRVMAQAGQQQHRGRASAPQKREPATHCAVAPNQVWCWDITYLLARVRGLYFYLYLVMDLYTCAQTARRETRCPGCLRSWNYEDLDTIGGRCQSIWHINP